jgi:DNA-binding transcriptional regulator GbsR (MarR family)
MPGQALSVVAVFHALKASPKALTHEDLRNSTAMPARTIRFAVRRLSELGLLNKQLSLKDARIAYFRLKEGATLEVEA